MPVSNKRFSEALLRLYAHSTVEGFSTNLIGCLELLFPGALFSIDEVFFNSGEVVHHGHSEPVNIPQLLEAWALYSYQNPLVRRLADQIQQPIETLADILSFRDLTRLELYQEGYRCIDFRDQIAISLPQPHSTWGITVNGGKVYTAADREMAALIYPHMAQALRNCILASPHARGRSRVCLELPVSSAGVVPHWTPEVRTLLDAFFGSVNPHPWRPPGELLDWIRRRHRAIRGGECDWRRLQPLFLRREQDELHINLAVGPDGLTEVLAVVALIAGQPGRKNSLAALTTREKEIAHWVAQGKTNGEIGIILGISPLTVKTHVEHILAKLGATNRTALATLV